MESNTQKTTPCYLVLRVHLRRGGRSPHGCLLAPVRLDSGRKTRFCLLKSSHYDLNWTVDCQMNRVRLIGRRRYEWGEVRKNRASPSLSILVQKLTKNSKDGFTTRFPHLRTCSVCLNPSQHFLDRQLFILVSSYRHILTSANNGVMFSLHLSLVFFVAESISIG